MVTARGCYSEQVSTEPGLRERKKQQRRQLIAETARRLFAERGFDRVTVAEIARAANVSEGTVFNYFPTKEDLFYDRMEVFESALLEAIREREAGEAVPEARCRAAGADGAGAGAARARARRLRRQGLDVCGSGCSTACGRRSLR